MNQSMKLKFMLSKTVTTNFNPCFKRAVVSSSSLSPLSSYSSSSPTLSSSSSLRCFSQESATEAAKETKEATTEYKFQNEKSEQIFHKMTQLKIEEIQTTLDLINEKLGIVITDADKYSYGTTGSGTSGAGGGSDGSSAESEEAGVEKTHYDLKLTGFDPKSKIKVIKEIRAMTSLGLKEAKAMVDGVPKVVKKDLKLEEADELKAKLEALGATVDLE